jgi:serine/threonine-protein kinase
MGELNATTEGAFSKYRPIAELGHGGMAQVYLALASGPAGFNKLVVLKQLKEQLAEDADLVAMFLDEARLAARLNHPNVVQTNEVGNDGSRFYICMEYLEGQPLNRVLHRLSAPAGFTLGMGLRILIDALAGLHHAHELRDYDGTPLEVVHRDATPHNVFLTYAGQVKVVDFGIAKALSSSTETRTGVLKGKVAYMAPEQALGERVDRRADVFSVGMMLWEVLVGKRPFKGLPDVAILQRLVNTGVPSPSTARADIPPELERICVKALSHAREDRYATAAEMANALEEAVIALGLPGTVRDAGRLIDQVFASERAKIQRLVETQVGEARPSNGLRLPVLTDPASVDTSSSAGVTRRDFVTSSTPAPKVRAELPGAAATTLSAATAAATSEHPGSARRDRAKVLAAIGVLALGGLVSVVYASLRGGVAPAAATAPVARAHTLLVDSTPQGAVVREGDVVLGTTPMTLELQPDAAPRRLIIAAEGYAPHTFFPTVDDARIMVPLAPLPAARTAAPADASGSAARAADKPPEHAKTPPRPSPPAPRTAAPSDINMAR